MKVGVLAKAGCCARKTARPADKDELWSGDVGISQIHERRAVIERRSFFCANLLKSEHLVRRRATRGPQVFDLFGIFGQKQRISNPCGRKFAQFANDNPFKMMDVGSLSGNGSPSSNFAALRALRPVGCWREPGDSENPTHSQHGRSCPDNSHSSPSRLSLHRGTARRGSTGRCSARFVALHRHWS